MAQVVVDAQRDVHAPASQVLTALGDYSGVRAQMLTEHFSEYSVNEDQSVVKWKLQATKKRLRECEFAIERSADSIVERDRNSSMVTTWRVEAVGELTRVSVHTTWNGAGGVGGFFEKTFAPLGMRKIYDAQLEKLSQACQ